MCFCNKLWYVLTLNYIMDQMCHTNDERLAQFEMNLLHCVLDQSACCVIGNILIGWLNKKGH